MRLVVVSDNKTYIVTAVAPCPASICLASAMEISSSYTPLYLTLVSITMRAIGMLNITIEFPS